MWSNICGNKKITLSDFHMISTNHFPLTLKTADFRKVTQEILERTGYANNVSDKPIILEIFSSNVITLQVTFSIWNNSVA